MWVRSQLTDPEAPALPARATLAPRLLMGVVVPATNMTTEAEMADLRPHGVINATARIGNPDRRVRSDADSAAVRAAMVDGLMAALDTLRPAAPDHVAIGVMVENFVGGGAAGIATAASILRRSSAMRSSSALRRSSAASLSCSAMRFSTSPRLF